MTEKILICPYFGELPPWFDHWEKNVARTLSPAGYSILLDFDEDSFRDRVREILGIEPPPMRGTGNIWDFRPAFGELYSNEIGDIEWWGHTDFDCVYGRVGKWVTDAFLYHRDLHSNHNTYVCGPWSLYRNHRFLNGLYRTTDEWRREMGRDGSDGWIEKGYSDIVKRWPTIRADYTLWQTKDWDDFSTLRIDPATDELYEGDVEVMMAHFRRTKEYPAGAIL